MNTSISRRQFLKASGLAAAGACAAGLLTGCGGSSSGSASGAASSGSSYTILYNSQPATLNYLTTGTDLEMVVGANCVDTLVEYDNKGVMREGLATSWDWDVAPLPWPFPLREETWEACNGEEAAEMIRQHRPDIVLLDVNMPLMDGLDALFQTRGLYFFVPIEVTGYSDFDYAKRAKYRGVQRYLLKPVVASELEEAIRFAQQKLEHHRLIAHELSGQTETTLTLV